MAKKILIVSGEPSGDLHASNLVKDLKSLKPDLEFFGLGGVLSRASGVDVVFDITKMAVVALVDVYKNIFTIGRAFTGLLKKIDSARPDLAILVDYPGFNLRLAKQLKKRNIPVIYYISPQIWAWGADRIHIIKRCVKKMVVFFKFEEELYKKEGVDAECIGHPLLDTVKPSLSKADVLKKYSFFGNKRVIALLPGSRISEVKTLLPAMAGAAAIINKELNGAQFVITKHKNIPIELYEKIAGRSSLDVKIVEGDVYNVLSAADFAIVASGTATLETAILGTPFIITYKSNLINYIAARIVFKKWVFGLVNIIAGKIIVPELLQYDATPEKMAAASLEIIRNEPRRSAMIEDLQKVKSSLGSPGARTRAARAILPYL